MIIYSHNLHEKLFGYAISREFIKYQSPFCDMLDDPSLALDFDLAIKFNQSINNSDNNTGTGTGTGTGTVFDPGTGTGTVFDPDLDRSGTNIGSNSNLPPSTIFTNTLILCSSDIDVTTLEFYRHKMLTYPIFAYEIGRINYIFDVILF